MDTLRTQFVRCFPMCVKVYLNKPFETRQNELRIFLWLFTEILTLESILDGGGIFTLGSFSERFSVTIYWFFYYEVEKTLSILCSSSIKQDWLGTESNFPNSDHL